ncbi:glycosyltransferase [Microbacterium schleiferi]|uniref:D-inositol 3-phosphate glycosyltransferase n=1 Tax=Microbacterium schleiferi TaxID=69362 RepID=A0A7S8MXH5_9MICO|nr:glycosyltransferase [Microbacterium schleiferi]QPE05004.1 glycosyltransferase [Microbacterium schleiferi]
MTGLVVHEWVEKSGGSEKVLDEIMRTYPDADMAVLWNDAPGRYSANVRESWLASTPLRRHKALALGAMPMTWRRLRAERAYSWMIVSSHLFAHHARLPAQPSVPKLVYAHTPARYIWVPELDARGRGPLTRVASSLLRPIDKRRAQEAASIVANSNFTRERIERTWGRESQVIYPPVDVERIASIHNWSDLVTSAEADRLDALPERFVLGASRFVEYKRLDLAIAVGEAAGIPVVLAGGGPHRGELDARARISSTQVLFIDSPSDAMLYALYERALAFVFGAIEDFGIMPVEAMAIGTPVICGEVGGVVESVIPGVSGASIHDWGDARELSSAVDTVSGLEPDAVRQRASLFSRSAFQTALKSWVDSNT